MTSRTLPVPGLYRPLVKLLHWAAFCLLLAALTAGLTPAIRWALVGVAGIWGLGFAVFGHLGRPGPALTGIAGRGFVPMHIGLLLAVVICAGMAIFAAPGPLEGAPRVTFLVTCGLGLLHGIFHLWRHTALGDGALRNMTPRILHGIL